MGAASRDDVQCASQRRSGEQVAEADSGEAGPAAPQRTVHCDATMTTTDDDDQPSPLPSPTGFSPADSPRSARCCPLTNDAVRHPFKASDGYTYSVGFLGEWVEGRGKISPVDRSHHFEEDEVERIRKAASAASDADREAGGAVSVTGYTEECAPRGRLEEVAAVKRGLPKGCQVDLKVKGAPDGIPEVVVIGEGRMGKTALINHIIGYNVLPTTTSPTSSGSRVKVQVNVQNGEAQVPLLSVRGLRGGEREYMIPAATGYIDVQKEMDRLTESLQDGECCTTHWIVITIRTPRLPDMIFTDAPGLVAAPTTEMERRYKLYADSILRRGCFKADTVILVALKAIQGPKVDLGMAFVQKLGILDDAIVVRTAADELGERQRRERRQLEAAVTGSGGHAPGKGVWTTACLAGDDDDDGTQRPMTLDDFRRVEKTEQAHFSTCHPQLDGSGRTGIRSVQDVLGDAVACRLCELWCPTALRELDWAQTMVRIGHYHLGLPAADPDSEVCSNLLRERIVAETQTAVAGVVPEIIRAVEEQGGRELCELIAEHLGPPAEGLTLGAAHSERDARARRLAESIAGAWNGVVTDILDILDEALTEPSPVDPEREGGWTREQAELLGDEAEAPFVLARFGVAEAALPGLERVLDQWRKEAADKISSLAGAAARDSCEPARVKGDAKLNLTWGVEEVQDSLLLGYGEFCGERLFNSIVKCIQDTAEGLERLTESDECIRKRRELRKRERDIARSVGEVRAMQRRDPDGAAAQLRRRRLQVESTEEKGRGRSVEEEAESFADTCKHAKEDRERAASAERARMEEELKQMRLKEERLKEAKEKEEKEKKVREEKERKEKEEREKKEKEEKERKEKEEREKKEKEEKEKKEKEEKEKKEKEKKEKERKEKEEK